jgi:hypothetical protein
VPKCPEHLDRAYRTEGLALALNKDIPVCVDWAVAMLFYAGLHFIDAYLAGKNVHPLDHTARDAEIENNGSLCDIYGDYRRLKDLSRAARYEIPNFTRANLDIAKARLERIKSHLFTRRNR